MGEDLALNKTVMKNLIKSKILAITDFPATGQHANFIRDDILEAFCDGVIEHFKAAAAVTTVTTGVQTGASTAPGTGGIT